MTVVGRVGTWEGNDADLVASARAGDLDAFASLYETHRQAIVGQCRRALRNDEEAADAAQETFLRAWRGVARIDDDQRFPAWLRTIAGNVCTDVLRRRRHTVPVEDLVDAASADDSEGLRAVSAAEASVNEAFDRLSRRHREVLRLREREGWTYEQIAADQQLEVSAVKSLLWRARRALRREYLDLV